MFEIDLHPCRIRHYIFDFMEIITNTCMQSQFALFEADHQNVGWIWEKSFSGLTSQSLRSYNIACPITVD